MVDIGWSLARMSDIGKRIISVGYNFGDLLDACRLYWELELDDEIDFDEKNIRFAGQDVLLGIASDHLERDCALLYSLLPEEKRRKYTCAQLAKVIWPATGSASLYEDWGPLTIWGVYSYLDDVCYLSEHLSDSRITNVGKESACIAAHELGHRYLDQKMAGMSPHLVDGEVAERFCLQLEGSFRSYVFAPDSRENTVEDVEAGREMILPLLEELLNPAMIEKHTREQVGYFSRLLDTRYQANNSVNLFSRCQD
jgi:hypothetical protein